MPAATPVLPGYAPIVADSYRITRSQDYRRTQFDDGAIRREKVRSQGYEYHAFSVRLANGTDLARFKAWVETYHNRIIFATRDATLSSATDEDDTLSTTNRTVSILNGPGGVEYSAEPAADGTMLWLANLTLELPL